PERAPPTRRRGAPHCPSQPSSRAEREGGASAARAIRPRSNRKLTARRSSIKKDVSAQAMPIPLGTLPTATRIGKRGGRAKTTGRAAAGGGTGGGETRERGETARPRGGRRPSPARPPGGRRWREG